MSLYLRRIGDIGSCEKVARIIRHGCERIQIARVSQFIDDTDIMIGLPHKVADNCRANESGAAGDEKSLRHQQAS